MSERHAETKPVWLAIAVLVATFVLASIAFCAASLSGKANLTGAATPGITKPLTWAYHVLDWGLLASVLVAMFDLRRRFAGDRRASFDFKVFGVLLAAMLLTGLVLVAALKSKAVIPLCVVYLVLSAGALMAWVVPRRKQGWRRRRLAPVDAFLALVFAFYAANTVFGLAISWSPKYAEAQVGTAGMQTVFCLYWTAYALGLVTLFKAEQTGAAGNGMPSGGGKGRLAGFLLTVIGTLAVIALVVIRVALATLAGGKSAV